MQCLDKEAHLLTNWTGKGARAVREGVDVSHIDLSLQNNGNAPAFPAGLFTDDNMWSSVSTAMDKLTTPHKISRFSTMNWTALYTVKRVPITAVFDPATHPAMFQRSVDGGTSLRDFHPLEMVSQNIGSNMGLLQLLYEENTKHNDCPVDERKYTTIVSDVNIFLRIIKVGECGVA